MEALFCFCFFKTSYFFKSRLYCPFKDGDACTKWTKWCFRVWKLCYYSSLSCFHIARRTYSREFLLDIRITFINPADAEKLHDCGLFWRPRQLPTRTPASNPQFRRHGRKMRKQKRGKWGGVQARLAASPHWSAIPTITLATLVMPGAAMLLWFGNAGNHWGSYWL